MSVHLDTHVVAWLYAGERARFPPRVSAILDVEPLVYSPIVGLELAYLHEIGRLAAGSRDILDYLGDRAGLVPDETPFLVVARAAERFTWTRDPFDRLIAAAAMLGNNRLLTADRRIREQLSLAFWD